MLRLAVHYPSIVFTITNANVDKFCYALLFFPEILSLIVNTLSSRNTIEVSKMVSLFVQSFARVYAVVSSCKVDIEAKNNVDPVFSQLRNSFSIIATFFPTTFCEFLATTAVAVLDPIRLGFLLEVNSANLNNVAVEDTAPKIGSFSPVSLSDPSSLSTSRRHVIAVSSIFEGVSLPSKNIHLGQFRASEESPPHRYDVLGNDLGRISKYCTRTSSEKEGEKCVHASDVIQKNHWSCCGGRDRNVLECIPCEPAEGEEKVEDEEGDEDSSQHMYSTDLKAKVGDNGVLDILLDELIELHKVMYGLYSGDSDLRSQVLLSYATIATYKYACMHMFLFNYIYIYIV